jgi:hypothetical protein
MFLRYSQEVWEILSTRHLRSSGGSPFKSGALCSCPLLPLGKVAVVAHTVYSNTCKGGMPQLHSNLNPTALVGNTTVVSMRGSASSGWHNFIDGCTRKLERYYRHCHKNLGRDGFTVLTDNAVDQHTIKNGYDETSSVEVPPCSSSYSDLEGTSPLSDSS